MEPIPTQDERTLAMLAHLLQIVAGWLGALIILLVRRESRFVSFHAVQVLLLQLAHFLLMVSLAFCWIFLMFIFAMTPRSSMPPFLPMLFVPLLMLAWLGPWIAILVLGISFGVRANRGEWAEYPVVGMWARKILHLGPDGTRLETTAST